MSLRIVLYSVVLLLLLLLLLMMMMMIKKESLLIHVHLALLLTVNFVLSCYRVQLPCVVFALCNVNILNSTHYHQRQCHIVVVFETSHFIEGTLHLMRN